MTINIQNLLNELVSYTVIQTSNISNQAKSVLHEMRQEIIRLEASSGSNKQTKMIELFIGGTILALKQDDWKYGYSFDLYPKPLTKEVFKNVQKNKPAIELMYRVGKQALLNLPHTFNENIFKVEGQLINSQKPIPFFPLLKENGDKINLLVKFCIKYAGNLNQNEVDEEDLDLVDLQLLATTINAPITHMKFETNQSYTHAPSTILSYTSMQVLGGFIAAIGVAAVAVAFVALNAATFGLAGLIVAGLGAAAILGGVGLFAAGTYKKYQSSSDVVIDDSLASVPM